GAVDGEVGEGERPGCLGVGDGMREDAGIGVAVQAQVPVDVRVLVGAVGDAGDGVVVADEVPDGVHQGGVLPGEYPVLVVVVGDAALEGPHSLGALRPEEAGRGGGARPPAGDR